MESELLQTKLRLPSDTRAFPSFDKYSGEKSLCSSWANWFHSANMVAQAWLISEIFSKRANPSRTLPEPARKPKKENTSRSELAVGSSPACFAKSSSQCKTGCPRHRFGLQWCYGFHDKSFFDHLPSVHDALFPASLHLRLLWRAIQSVAPCFLARLSLKCVARRTHSGQLSESSLVT